MKNITQNLKIKAFVPIKTRKAAPTAENSPLSMILTCAAGLINIAYNTIMAI